MNLNYRDIADLTQQICDINSVSGNETELADAVEALWNSKAHLEVLRDGDTLVARTNFGSSQRVVIAGHLDTVPVAANLPTRIIERGGEPVLWGRGAVDMKGGVAVIIALAAELEKANRDISWVLYDHEEVDAAKNGLGRIARNHPDWLAGDFAILGEPTNAGIEGGCNGTLRVRVTFHGKAAHSARAWRGHNAIHDAAALLQRLAAYVPRTITVEGLDYRESLNAVTAHGGIATNVIPDALAIEINYRFAPDTGVDDAYQHVLDALGLERGTDDASRESGAVTVELTDSAPGARPGLDRELAREFADTVERLTGGKAGPKYGWTDVARFAELGVPAVNFGPGDPMLAHADDEHVPLSQLYACEYALRTWLS